jgi:hypothetical protein
MTYGLRVTASIPPINQIQAFPLQIPAKSCKIRNPRATRIDLMTKHNGVSTFSPCGGPFTIGCPILNVMEMSQSI